MKEQRIIIEIDQDGRMTADADGFSGDACLDELTKLLDGLSPGTAKLERKPDAAGPVKVSRARQQTVGKKG